ncbi:gfo/Idh/MocA family oxidoreductase [Opitutaceae bacterium TAV4]|nr:gfo/Idh/MocA family oxidoreductase [Opitutaceae bacterium TAV4]RRK02666.1 gfo/Idh/MocA family oxidoreductase [Opitutaceae bacterium TAV3]
MSKPRTYAAVGTGGRIPMFIDPIATTWRESARLVGLCDLSATRRRHHQKRLSAKYGLPIVPDYDAANFERMLAEQKPDAIIVCTSDCTHHDYIVRALDAGCDVITEKPLTIDAEKLSAIDAALKRNPGRSVRVAFNYRWSPGATRVRQLLAEGVIGEIKHVHYEYMLNTSHGADYFRRWHSYKACSGGLLIHKATHHFDLLNWWLDAIPSDVFARGGLAFYGKENAVARGQANLTRYPRYTGHPESAGDPFRLTLDDDPDLRALYLDAEADSGYIRDENVFRDGITIEDTMSLLIRYRTGVTVNYSLNAFCPNEGCRVSFTGDAGRLDYVAEHASHIITGDSDIKIMAGGRHDMRIRLQKHFREAEEFSVKEDPGGHGGGDPLLQEQLFSAAPPSDPFRRAACHEQGAASILVGIAANRSMETGEAVMITDLFPLAPGAIRLSELR